MFTTSRSGTPRRSLAPRSRAGTPAKSVYHSPPGGSGRRASSTGFHQTTPAPAALETRKPVEDSHTLVLDENHRVSLGFSVPHELQHAMDACGLTYGDMLSFSLDFNANYALLIAPTCVYAWNFGKKVTPNNSNSLTFAVPPSNISPHDLAVAVYAPVPLAALVNYPSGREPGLVVCSVDGHLRFWDSLSVALTGVERFSTALLPQLEKGEIVRHLISISPASFIASTSSAKLYRIIVTSAGGRASLAVSPVIRPRNMLSRLGNTFLGFGGALPLSSNLGYIALCPIDQDTADGNKILWAVRARAVECWRLHPTDAGGEMLLDEWDGIDAKIREQLLEEGDGLRGIMPQTLDLQILDAQPQGPETLVFLLSHAAPAGSRYSRGFALAVISFSSNPPMLEHLSKLTYTADPDPRPLASPKLVLSSKATFIVFADVVLIKNTALEERIVLKQTARARFIGFAINDKEQLFLPTATNGVLKTEVLDPAPPQGLTLQQLQTLKLTSQLERAVMFADRQDNPLSFELSLSDQGDLAQAVETVSAGILTSTSQRLSHPLDLRSSLTERSERLHALAVLLNELGLVDRLPELTRQRLAWDAECVSAAAALWQIYNTGEIGRDHQSLLYRAIESYLYEHGEDVGDDVVRPFFRYKVAYVGQLLEVIDRTMKTALNGLSMSSSRQSASSRVPILLEANRVWLAVFSAVERHRKDGNMLYRISALQGAVKEAWTSRVALLDALQFLFDGTEQTLILRSRELGLSPSEDHSNWNTQETSAIANDAQAELKAALVEEAEFLLAIYEERLLFLKRNHSNSQDLAAFEERFFATRPRIITSLLTIGRPNPAFALAEQHQDFPTLVTLCQDPTVGSTTKSNHFVEKYSSEFAFALFDWLIAKNQLQGLLDIDHRYSELLSQYFQQTENGRLSWLHNINLGLYQQAAVVLNVEAAKTKSLLEQKTMLSIGKLAEFAQTTSAVNERWNEKLDVVEMHRVMIDAFRKGFSQAEMLASPKKQAELILVRFGAAVGERKSFVQIFKDFIIRILHGKSLSTEDLVDLYTLQAGTKDPFRGDTIQEADEDQDLKASISHWNFPPALQLLASENDLPTSRSNVALSSLWRRAYLRDDWRLISQSANYTDDQLAQIVKSTAMFQVMLSVKTRKLSPTLILSPSASLVDQTDNPTIKGRFTDAPPELLSGLITDYEAESAELSALIGPCCLNDFFAEAQRLVESST